MTDITQQTLLDAGYKKFDDPSARYVLGDWYRASFQKRFTDEIGTRYFITFCYSVTSHAIEYFTPSNQFGRDGRVFNVEMVRHSETLEEVEAFFEDLWRTMRLDYYEAGGS